METYEQAELDLKAKPEGELSEQDQICLQCIEESGTLEPLDRFASCTSCGATRRDVVMKQELRARVAEAELREMMEEDKLEVQRHKYQTSLSELAVNPVDSMRRHAADKEAQLEIEQAASLRIAHEATEEARANLTEIERQNPEDVELDWPAWVKLHRTSITIGAASTILVFLGMYWLTKPKRR
jgi:hypothetical protein